MIVHVYEVTRLFVVEVPDALTKPSAFESAIQLARSGKFLPTSVVGQMIAVEPPVRVDPRDILRRLLALSDSALDSVMVRYEVADVQGPVSERLAALLRRVSANGKLAQLQQELCTTVALPG